MPWLRGQVVSKQSELWRVAPRQGDPTPFGGGHPQLRVLVFIPLPQVSLQCPQAAQGHHLPSTKTCKRICSQIQEYVLGISFKSRTILFRWMKSWLTTFFTRLIAITFDHRIFFRRGKLFQTFSGWCRIS